MYVEQGLAMSAIGAKVGVSKRPVRKWLVDAGIPIKPSYPSPHGPGKIDVPLDKETFSKLYLDDQISLREIAEMYNVSRPVISRLRDKYGIPIRDHRPRKHIPDETFFSDWSSSMAYVLGIIAADGHLTKDRYVVSISSNDVDFLAILGKAVGLDDPLPISQAKRQTQTLGFTSKQAYNDLLSLGITPNKSLTLSFPPVPGDFLGDFTRGYFDGDGSVCCYRNGRSLYVSIGSGSKDFIYTLEARLNTCGLSKWPIKHRESQTSKRPFYELKYHSYDDISRIYALMYPPGCKLFMPRKKQVFDDFLA